MSTIRIELDDATDAAVRDRAAAEDLIVEVWIARVLRKLTEAAHELHAARSEAAVGVWTAEAVAAVHAAEAELANGGGLSHADVKQRTRVLLGG